MENNHSSEFCRRCLLSEIRDWEAKNLAEQVREWIRSIPASQLADQALVAGRLKACRACPHLNRGTCEPCGCYVEYRAAHVLRNCPDLPGRWPAEHV